MTTVISHQNIRTYGDAVVRSFRRRAARSVPRALVSLILVLVITGCAQEDRPLLTQADLDARPQMVEMQARYGEMERRIRDALDTAMGPQNWINNGPDSASHGTCGRNFEHGVIGRVLSMPTWKFNAPITDAQWPAVKTAVLAVLAEYGFQPGGMAIDSGTDHQLNAYDLSLGAYFSIGNAKNTVMRTTTGCHPGKPVLSE